MVSKAKRCPASTHSSISSSIRQASLEGCSLRIEWSQARSDKVCVDRTQRLGFCVQKVTGNSSFACAVGSCNDDNFLQNSPMVSRFFSSCRVNQTINSALNIELFWNPCQTNKDLFAKSLYCRIHKPFNTTALGIFVPQETRITSIHCSVLDMFKRSNTA